MAMIPYFKPEVVATLETLTPVQIRALAEVINQVSSQTYFQRIAVRPNVLSTHARFATDSELADSWRTFVHYLSLPDSVPTHDEYDSPYSIVRLR